MATRKSSRRTGSLYGGKRGGSRKRIHSALIFTEARLSLPGPWQPVVSSRVTETRYDYGLEQIHVVFRDGTPWVYDNVPEEVFNQFVSSESPGRFINGTLNSFPYRRGDFGYGDDATDFHDPEDVALL